MGKNLNICKRSLKSWFCQWDASAGASLEKKGLDDIKEYGRIRRQETKKTVDGEQREKMPGMGTQREGSYS